MPKYLLEDMVKAKRERRGMAEVRKEPRENGAKKILEEIGDAEARERKTNQSKKERPRYLLWFVALISAVFCLFAVSFLFSRAEITVNPKIKEVSLNQDLSASKDTGGSGLSFDLVSIDGTENKSVQANGEKDVADKATGTVIIYNNYSSASQTLKINTNLEGSNGKMYQTQDKIVVPGKSKTGTPGSIEVKVAGEKAGEEYNSDPLDFKILGFKGTAKYAKFYGRSKDALTGGLLGKVPAIPEADRTAALADLKSSLKAKLLKKATNQIPSGFVLFNDAVFLSASDSDISTTNNKDNSVTFSQKGTLYGLLFNEQKLTQKIAEKNIDQYDGSEVYLPNIKNLTFTLANKDNIPLGDIKDINFNLSGNTRIVWKLDESKFTSDLLGKPKKDFNQILAQYPNIDSATLVLNLPWIMSLPSDAKNIKVNVNYPQ